MRTSHALLIAVCITLVAVNARTASSWQADQDDDYFRLSIPSTQESRKPAIVNPKKSALPIGPSFTYMHWNETSFAYFGGWGQLVSTDIHYFYIDTEAISMSLSEVARQKPMYLHLQQKGSESVHIQLYMSNGEYPTPIKHKFSCNTKNIASVNIKLPPFTHAAHWLIRVQPSEPMSVWSKPLEYSLRLYEREAQTDTFSESWEGFFFTFLVVLGATIGVIFYLRKSWNQKAKEREEQLALMNGHFRNLNSDQQLLSLAEAQEKAKHGQLEQKDGFGTLNRANTQFDVGRVVDTIMRRNSPDPSPQNSSEPVSAPPSTVFNNPEPPSTPPKPRTQVFTRASPSHAAPNTATSSNSSQVAASSQVAKSTSSTMAGATMKESKPPATPPKPTAPKATGTTSNVSTSSGSKQSSNVQKMAAFWANPK